MKHFPSPPKVRSRAARWTAAFTLLLTLTTLTWWLQQQAVRAAGSATSSLRVATPGQANLPRTATQCALRRRW